MIQSGKVEVRREGRRVYVQMHGPEYLSEDKLLRRAFMREDEAREAASASGQAYEEMEEAYRKEIAEHKETKEVVIAVRVTAIVLLVLLIASVLVSWFVLR